MQSIPCTHSTGALQSQSLRISSSFVESALHQVEGTEVRNYYYLSKNDRKN